MPTNHYIKILGPNHILYILALIFILYFLFARKEELLKRKKLVDRILIGVVFLQQILLYGSYYIYTGLDVAESLPLHICRVCSILVMLFLATKNIRVFEMASFFGLFALLSFIYPSKVYGLSHPIGYSFFICHATNLLVGLYGIKIHGMKIHKGAKNRAFLSFLVYLSTVLVVNPLLNGNYFYLRDKPVLAFLPNAIYVPLIIVLTYVFFTLGEKLYCYLQEEKEMALSPILNSIRQSSFQVGKTIKLNQYLSSWTKIGD